MRLGVRFEAVGLWFLARTIHGKSTEEQASRSRAMDLYLEEACRFLVVESSTRRKREIAVKTVDVSEALRWFLNES